jgi:hypothetical protein
VDVLDLWDHAFNRDNESQPISMSFKPCLEVNQPLLQHTLAMMCCASRGPKQQTEICTTVSQNILLLSCLGRMRM